MRGVIILLAIILGITFSNCSKKTTAAKKSKELRKKQKPSNPEERKLLRFERRLKLSPEEREAIGNIKEGRPYSAKQYKMYSKHYKKKRKIEKKIKKMTRKKQQRLQTHKTKKRMNENMKKAERNNRYRRNHKINK